MKQKYAKTAAAAAILLAAAAALVLPARAEKPLPLQAPESALVTAHRRAAAIHDPADKRTFCESVLAEYSAGGSAESFEMTAWAEKELERLLRAEMIESAVNAGGAEDKRQALLALQEKYRETHDPEWLDSHLWASISLADLAENNSARYSGYAAVLEECFALDPVPELRAALALYRQYTYAPSPDLKEAARDAYFIRYDPPQDPSVHTWLLEIRFAEANSLPIPERLQVYRAVRAEAAALGGKSEKIGFQAAWWLIRLSGDPDERLAMAAYILERGSWDTFGCESALCEKLVHEPDQAARRKMIAHETARPSFQPEKLGSVLLSAGFRVPDCSEKRELFRRSAEFSDQAGTPEAQVNSMKARRALSETIFSRAEKKSCLDSLLAQYRDRDSEEADHEFIQLLMARADVAEDAGEKAGRLAEIIEFISRKGIGRYSFNLRAASSGLYELDGDSEALLARSRRWAEMADTADADRWHLVFGNYSDFMLYGPDSPKAAASEALAAAAALRGTDSFKNIISRSLMDLTDRLRGKEKKSAVLAKVIASSRGRDEYLHAHALLRRALLTEDLGPFLSWYGELADSAAENQAAVKTQLEYALGFRWNQLWTADPSREDELLRLYAKAGLAGSAPLLWARAETARSRSDKKSLLDAVLGQSSDDSALTKVYQAYAEMAESIPEKLAVIDELIGKVKTGYYLHTALLEKARLTESPSEAAAVYGEIVRRNDIVNSLTGEATRLWAAIRLAELTFSEAELRRIYSETASRYADDIRSSHQTAVLYSLYRLGSLNGDMRPFRACLEERFRREKYRALELLAEEAKQLTFDGTIKQLAHGDPGFARACMEFIRQKSAAAPPLYRKELLISCLELEAETAGDTEGKKTALHALTNLTNLRPHQQTSLIHAYRRLFALAGTIPEKKAVYEQARADWEDRGSWYVTWQLLIMKREIEAAEAEKAHESD